MEGATIAVECDANNAWLVWTDGGKTAIDARTNIVEGTLDAIEDRIARTKRGAGASGAASGAEPGAAGTSVGAPSTGRPPGETPPEESSTASSEKSVEHLDRTAINLEGGVGLALLTEFWSGAYTAGMGPRLDVGVGVGRKLSVVISEGARFAIGNGSGQLMSFDLQAGLAYGAPYQYRTGLGVMMLVGAERLASANDSNGYQGVVVWAATFSLGGRASIATGPLDVWIGVDGMLRSSTIETSAPEATKVPTLAAILSIGCFLPAFAGGGGEEHGKVNASKVSASR